MSDLRQAASFALTTLQGWSNYDNWPWPRLALAQAKQNTAEAIPLLEAALAETEPEEPTDGEVVELVAWLLEGGEDAAANGWDHQARQFARAAELLQLQHPQP